MISSRDVAQIEQWAASSYPHHGDDISVVVHARGLHVNVQERRSLPGGSRSRSLVRLRYIADRHMWTVHRLYAGGRWLERKPPDGSLLEILAAIDLARVPPP